MWKNWVLDVTNGCESPLFCPIEDDGTIVIGMNILSNKCPGKLVGIFHTSGVALAQQWMEENGAVLDDLKSS